MEINTHKILQKQTENYITFNQIKLREITNIEERIKILTQMNDEMERKIENLKKQQEFLKMNSIEYQPFYRTKINEYFFKKSINNGKEKE